MSNISSYSCLLTNSWPVPGEQRVNSVNFLSYTLLTRLSGTLDQLAASSRSKMAELSVPAAAAPKVKAMDYWTSGTRLANLRSLLLTTVQDHPSIPPTAFIEATDFLCSIFTKSTYDSIALVRTVGADLEILLAASIFVYIRAHYDSSFTEANFNAVSDSRYAGYVEPSPWRSVLEMCITLRGRPHKQADLTGLEKARLCMMRDLLPAMRHFQGAIEAAQKLNAVANSTARMQSQAALAEKRTSDHNAGGGSSLTAMAEQVTLPSPPESTSLDELAVKGHENARTGSGSASSAGAAPNKDFAADVASVAGMSKHVRVKDYAYPDVAISVVASAALNFCAPIVVRRHAPAPPQVIRNDCPSPIMPTPVVVQVEVAPPVIQASSKRARDEFPFPIMSTPVDGSAPSIKVWALMIDDESAVPLSPTLAIFPTTLIGASLKMPKRAPKPVQPMPKELELPLPAPLSGLVTSSSDTATLVGSPRPSVSSTTSYASQSSADWSPTHRTNPSPVRRVVRTVSNESNSSAGWLADASAPPTPDFVASTTTPAAPEFVTLRSKLSAFMRKLQLLANTSRLEESMTSHPVPPVLSALGFANDCPLVTLTFPSFQSSSQDTQDSLEQSMEQDVLVPVPFSAELEIMKESRRWVGWITSPTKWFSSRINAEKVQEAA